MSMKRLNTQEWSLIKRYLKAETSLQDLARLDILWAENPTLKSEIDMLYGKVPLPSPEDFDATQAFEKLHNRFKREDLI
jgi:hypothetical protein